MHMTQSRMGKLKNNLVLLNTVYVVLCDVNTVTWFDMFCIVCYNST